MVDSDQILCAAAQQGDLKRVQDLIKQGSDTNAKDSRGATALHLASYEGHKDIVAFLLKNKADINARESHGLTSLDVAVMGNQKGIVELLIKSGSDVNARAHAGTTPLHSAAYFSATYLAKLLLSKGADPNIKDFASDVTALHVAVVKQNTELVKVLLHYRADINAVTTSEWKYAVDDETLIFYPPATPLHVAAQIANPTITRLLLKAGARTDLKERDGSTALHIAVTADTTTEVVRVLLEYHAPVNAVDRDGWTPLHAVARYGSVRAAELLLKAGANANAKSTKVFKTTEAYGDIPMGSTPLDIATRLKRQEIITLLNTS